MRQRLVALAAAATLAATAAAPAFADSSPAATAPTSLFHCSATATLTQNGRVLYSVSRTFNSANDLTRTINQTYTLNGKTFTISATISCAKA
jgi:hypothetical protein